MSTDPDTLGCFCYVFEMISRGRSEVRHYLFTLQNVEGITSRMVHTTPIWHLTTDLQLSCVSRKEVVLVRDGRHLSVDPNLPSEALALALPLNHTPPCPHNFQILHVLMALGVKMCFRRERRVGQGNFKPDGTRKYCGVTSSAATLNQKRNCLRAVFSPSMSDPLSMLCLYPSRNTTLHVCRLMLATVFHAGASGISHIRLN